jgi:hypothetical protein
MGITTALISTSLLLAASSPVALELSTWGAPGETRVSLTLTAAGRLEVERQSLPITAQGLTRRRFSKEAGLAWSGRIVALAEAVEDFARGCNQAADGTSALLIVRRGGRERRDMCENAVDWPRGDQVKALLAAINEQLPTEWKVR